MTPSPKPNSAILPLALSTGAVLLASAWVYRHTVLLHHRRRRDDPKEEEVEGDEDGDVPTRARRAGSSLMNPRGESSSKDASSLPMHTEIITNDHDNGNNNNDNRRLLSPGTITIAYASTTGTCASFARRLYDALRDRRQSHHDDIVLGGGDGERYHVQLLQVSHVDWWDEVVNMDENDNNDDNSNNNSNNNNRDGGGTNQVKHPPILLFLLPTWTGGKLPPESQNLMESLEEIENDWRVAPEPLRMGGEERRVRVGVFGMGSSAYDIDTVGKPAKQVFSHWIKLGARPLVTAKPSYRMGSRGDGGGSVGDNVSKAERKSKSFMIGDSEAGDADAVFDQWARGVVESVVGIEGGSRRKKKNGEGVVKTLRRKNNGVERKKNGEEQKDTDRIQQMQELQVKKEDSAECACKQETNSESTGCCKESKDESNACCKESKEESRGCCSTNNVVNENESATDSLSEDDDDDDDDASDIVDVEDMGRIMNDQALDSKSLEPQEMVTKKQARALKKEGYKLIGTHSAVKLCRWTKHQLRGRGGCYKHTHYGITSYQCMEATPSLACANKCVFCWRHHKNPVGREWRWKTDDPKMIVQEAINTHVGMIKETKGIPGIQLDRWEEAHRVRHCALSLVGEPIMYPRINELLQELHERKISTFLVTNGQHPQAIENLVPITQLYVSVDASTPESLEEIDRPLFRDAWDRLKASLSCLKNKGQRTVARLTVVKGWNSDEIGGYARLIALGHCSLVEVKGVTFCGKSDASNLNMTNTPWHHEVVEFSKRLLHELKVVREQGGDKDDILPEYDLACEHKHSCSVLLARVDQFSVPDPNDPTKRKWRTWIDYDKFQELAARHAADPSFKFGVEDYVADTPEWAVFGANEEGFDPTDNRHRRKKKHPMYARFDEDGVPTHDTYDEPLPTEEIIKLKGMMEKKKMELGDESTITEFKSGEKRIEDASLMFRGLVVIR